MLTVVDDDIPFAGEAFSRFGDVKRVASKAMMPAALHGADALIVRSVTRVDAALLDGSSISFVGTATAGVDHIDLNSLQQRNIAFADAAGANANAVAEYIVAALLHLRAAPDANFATKTLGIIGCGHVGRRVARYATALGIRCVIHDPPLGRSTCEPLYRPLEEALACDVITLHVPLERAGTDPTYHLVNDAFLEEVNRESVLINTSRGAVIDTIALKRAAKSGRINGLILDVWENEPNIDVELASLCRIATSHIAGHTLDAKLAAVQQLADAFTTHLNPVGAAPRGRPHLTEDSEKHKGDHGESPPPTAELPCDSIADAVRASFDIVEADRRLRETLYMKPAERAVAFDALRSGWPARREFHVRPIGFDNPESDEGKTLRTLGFRISAPAPTGVAHK